MSVKQNKAAMQAAIEKWNKGDLEGYLGLYDPRIMMHGLPGVESGIESVQQFYQGFWAAFPGNRLTLDDVVGEGDKVAARFTVTGTNSGSFMGMPPTGKQVSTSGITVLRFSNGKCVERWSQSDFIGLMQQLGMAGAPA